MRWGALVAIMAAACAPLPPLPPQPVPAGPSIAVEAQAVPLDPTNPSRAALGRFAYAGGLVLSSSQTSRLHGLSDLKVTADGRMIAIGDQSDLLEAQIVLDSAGRLSGLTEARLLALKDPAGVDFYAGGQEEYDSEGIVRLADGTLVVTYEQNDRVFAFAAPTANAKPAPKPQTAYVHNKGMEAVMAAPEAGADAYRVGIEKTGALFLCRLSAACVADGQVDLKGSELVSMDALPGGGRAYLFRSFSPLKGNVVELRLVDEAGRELDSMTLARPLTVDNLEGVAAVARPDGVIRFYLVADDNFGTFNGQPTDQRTLLLAFDWKR